MFNRHYVAPVCSPTRVALMTGRYWSRFDCNGALPSEPDSKALAMPPGTEAGNTTRPIYTKGDNESSLHQGDWKLIQRKSGNELFNITGDECETRRLPSASTLTE